VILGLLLKSDEFLLTIRLSNDSWEFRRCVVEQNEPGESPGSGRIWDRADDDIRKAYLEADTLAVALPASACMIKRMEIDKKLEDEIPGYRKWRAGMELPGDPEQFRYGFIPNTEVSGDKSEVIFFAVPADYLQRLTNAAIREGDSREIRFLPEQTALAEFALKSARDYSQVALAHFDRQCAVMIVLRDGRFFKGRYFQFGDGGNDEIAVDIETFMLSVASPDESLPLIVTGSADGFETSWSPILPTFLERRYLEFSSVWGITEFISRGGRCELQAAR
jgi:hypothetical protein